MAKTKMKILIGIFIVMTLLLCSEFFYAVCFILLYACYCLFAYCDNAGAVLADVDLHCRGFNGYYCRYEYMHPLSRARHHMAYNLREIAGICGLGPRASVPPVIRLRVKIGKLTGSVTPVKVLGFRSD